MKTSIPARLRPLAQALLPLGLSLGLLPAAHAGATLKIDENNSISIGGGLRVSYSSVEDGAPSGSSRSNDFTMESARLYMSARIQKVFGVTFNLNGSEDEVKVLDAYAQYEPSPLFNVWMGRMLPPTDRANLDGPYYLSAWDYPGLVSSYPALFAGRDNGVTVWGKPLDGKLTYAFGLFQGHNRKLGLSNEDAKLLFAGRVAYAFLDAEPAPAYYTASTYYGAKDIFTVGLAMLQQSNGVGTAGNKDDYLGYNVDVLFEKNLGPGVLTLEGAAYKYDFKNVDVAPASGNVGGLAPGKAYLAGAAWLFPQAVGPGKFQPFVRYQRSSPDGPNNEVKAYDLGLNYVIAGHNARLSAVYTSTDSEVTGKKLDKFLVGAQFQY